MAKLAVLPMETIFGGEGEISCGQVDSLKADLRVPESVIKDIVTAVDNCRRDVLTWKKGWTHLESLCQKCIVDVDVDVNVMSIPSGSRPTIGGKSRTVAGQDPSISFSRPYMDSQPGMPSNGEYVSQLSEFGSVLEQVIQSHDQRTESTHYGVGSNIHERRTDEFLVPSSSWGTKPPVLQNNPPRLTLSHISFVDY